MRYTRTVNTVRIFNLMTNAKFQDELAVVMQNLKSVMRDTPNWECLKPSQREALEMIQHKIGRILNGDPDYDDNWVDISGYATLVVEELRGNKR